MDSKKIRNKLIWQTIAAVVFVIGLIIILIFQYVQFWSLTIKKNELNNQLALLEKQHYIFEQEYEYKSSDEFVEDYAHEVLGWGRNGESYYN